jgi:hypothetical protein
MIFEVGYLKVISPLDPRKGQRYVNLGRGGFESGGIENVYNLNSRMEYYDDPTKDGKISWHIFISCALDSDEDYKIDNNELNEVSTRISVQIT